MTQHRRPPSIVEEHNGRQLISVAGHRRGTIDYIITGATVRAVAEFCVRREAPQQWAGLRRGRSRVTRHGPQVWHARAFYKEETK